MTPQELINNAGELISLPEACVRVNQLVNDPRSSAEEIGEIISQDPALSARLLRVVNSAFYGFPSNIDTISRAVTIIGTRELCDLAMLTAFCDMFNGIPGNLVNMETYWRSSITCGVLAKHLAKTSGVLHPERLFVMGVLHDIGRLVLFQQLPTESRDIMLISKGRDDLIVSAEREQLGFTHGDVGYQLVVDWGLPPAIGEVMRCHHHPELAEESPLECYLVYIANVISDALVWDGDLQEAYDRIQPSAWEITGLDARKCHEHVPEIDSEIRELYAVLMGDSGRTTTA